MPTLSIDRSNQDFAEAAAGIIDITGLALGQYHDADAGCYCTLGAFRILVFGSVRLDHSSNSQYDRYRKLVGWFAGKLRDDERFLIDPTLNPETIIGLWNDASSKEAVVNKLREVGRSVNNEG